MDLFPPSQLEICVRQDINDGNVKTNDCELMDEMADKLEHMQSKHNQSWKEYMKVTKQAYDEKYNIDKKQKVNKQIYKVGNKVVYYVGDQQLPNKKWRQRWTGPWNIYEVLDERTIYIGKEDDIKLYRAGIDRCKIYHEREYYKYDTFEMEMKDRIFSNKKGPMVKHAKEKVSPITVIVNADNTRKVRGNNETS